MPNCAPEGSFAKVSLQYIPNIQVSRVANDSHETRSSRNCSKTMLMNDRASGRVMRLPTVARCSARSAWPGHAAWRLAGRACRCKQSATGIPRPPLRASMRPGGAWPAGQAWQASAWPEAFLAASPRVVGFPSKRGVDIIPHLACLGVLPAFQRGISRDLAAGRFRALL